MRAGGLHWRRRGDRRGDRRRALDRRRLVDLGEAMAPLVERRLPGSVVEDGERQPGPDRPEVHRDLVDGGPTGVEPTSYEHRDVGDAAPHECAGAGGSGRRVDHDQVVGGGELRERRLRLALLDRLDAPLAPGEEVDARRHLARGDLRGR